MPTAPPRCGARAARRIDLVLDPTNLYAVLSEEYAVAIASDWNVNAGGSGYVTRFRVETEYVRRYASQRAGGKDILELWIPAEDLADFNAHIVGPIEVTHEFRSDGEVTS